jgi:hypothetical protein
VRTDDRTCTIIFLGIYIFFCLLKEKYNFFKFRKAQLLTQKATQNKTTLHLGWSHCCKNYTVIITGCMLRNIHISNGNGFCHFYADFGFPLSPTRLLPDLTIWVSRWVSYKKQELLTLRKHLGSPLFFGGIRVDIFVSFICCAIYFVLLVYVLCLVPNVTQLSKLFILDCPFDFF